MRQTGGAVAAFSSLDQVQQYVAANYGWTDLDPEKHYWISATSYLELSEVPLDPKEDK